MSQSANKRLAKNTLLLYFRMISLMIITLYTSRVVLQQLGIVDYGIYNLVASVTAIFSSLRELFASTTQRYLNNAMGKGEENLLQKIFSISITIHFFVAILFFIIVEVVGLWFFEYEINVASDRLFAAYVVFHISVVSAIIGILTIPYDSEIIAHERMDVYAYIAIFEGCAKLLVALMLSLSNFDKLIIYAVLLLIIQSTTRVAIYLFCRKKFIESHFKWCADKTLFKEMTGFAGWQFFGNVAYSMIHEGTNMVLNVFGGPVVNAARGVTAQVNSALSQFLNSITTAVNPHIVKLYAKSETGQMFKMFFFMSKLLFFVQLIMVVPVYSFSEELLSVWLVEVPEYTLTFLKIILIWSLVRSLHSPIDTLFKAVGKIKKYQLYEGILPCLTPVAAYFSLKMGLPFYSVFLILLLVEILNLTGILKIAQTEAGLDLFFYFKKVICSGLIMSTVLFFFIVDVEFISDVNN